MILLLLFFLISNPIQIPVESEELEEIEINPQIMQRPSHNGVSNLV